METGIDLYYFPASPPTRAVMLLIKAMGLIVNMKMVNIMEGEQLKSDFLKLNPMHTVPTIDDNGYTLWESRAIMQYLVDRYDKEGQFSTDDPKQRGKVNQLLYFDADMLFPRAVAYFQPVVMSGAPPNAENLKKLEESLAALDKLLPGNFAVGSKLSLADFSLVSTISTVEAVQVDLNKYPNVKSWYENIKKQLSSFDYEGINQKGSDMIKEVFLKNIK